ncbi:porin [Ramlibacter sp. PS4R-6]|uniref:porin n=1 Tax=Ramlibacter sp. PS4R-6 TaxID=3133438 RepID=UPI0030B179E7
MKKSLIALAALAATSAAFAQSSVTLFGALDAMVSRYSQNGVHKTMMSTSGNTSSALGVRGVEDLGGGMYAGFWLEAAILNDAGLGNGTGGAVVFQRRSYLSLAGPFGQLRLGRDYTPSFWNHTVFDPFGTLGAGSGANVSQGGGTNGAAGDNPTTAARTNNGLSYLWGMGPNASSHIGTGVYAQITYAFAENLSTAAATNRYLGARVGYAAGPFNVAGAVSRSNSAAGPVFKYKNWNLGGSYDFGMAKVMAKIGVNDSDLAGTKHTYWSLGGTIPVGAGYIPLSWGHIKVNNAAGWKANQLALGYVHNLSKRTAAYATYSHISNKNGGNFTFLGGNGGGNPGFAGTAAAAGSGTGIDVGIKHSF